MKSLFAALLALVSTTALAQNLETRVLFANSYCKHSVRFLIHHKDSVHPHHSHAWYYFSPWEGKRLQAGGITLRQIVGENLYIFAETVNKDPPLQWSGNDAQTVFNNVTYTLKKVPLLVNSRGELEFRFSCS